MAKVCPWPVVSVSDVGALPAPEVHGGTVPGPLFQHPGMTCVPPSAKPARADVRPQGILRKARQARCHPQAMDPGAAPGPTEYDMRGLFIACWARLALSLWVPSKGFRVPCPQQGGDCPCSGSFAYEQQGSFVRRLYSFMTGAAGFLETHALSCKLSNTCLGSSAVEEMVIKALQSCCSRGAFQHRHRQHAMGHCIFDLTAQSVAQSLARHDHACLHGNAD